MIELGYSEFYITNVCNLNCPDCNRFNNFAFTGHQKWDDYSEIYSNWAKILDIKNISILGGEPTLNPDFTLWVNGISTLWPNSQINIVTNGTQLKKWPELYDKLLKFKNIHLNISSHGISLRETLVNELTNWMQGTVTKTYDVSAKSRRKLWDTVWNNIRAENWPDCPGPENLIDMPIWIQEECERRNVSLKYWEDRLYGWVFTDCNDVKATINLSNEFSNSSLLVDIEKGKINLYDSDPDKAIEVCYSKFCHHFIRGKLFKCNVVGVLPEFISQFPVEVSDSDKELINGYIPANINWEYENIASFIKDLKQRQSIPQCKFCPEKFNSKQFEAGTKKIKFHKQKN
jgi:organic radical activating enzyme